MSNIKAIQLAALLLLRLISLVQSQQSDFQTCLVTQPKNITVVASSDSTFKDASQPFNLRINPSPNMIVYPLTTVDVSKILDCAASSGLTVSARSGGHSYAGYGLSGDVVVDLSNMKNITVDDSSGTAVIQTGVLLGELAEALWNNGQRALPHGTCPYVGTGGHPLYGGFGLYSRTAGLLLDHIQAAEVVIANGSIITASNESNSDLFWALRGGGASFGIVTAWTFDTLPAPEITVTYEIDFSTGALTADIASDIFLKWQDFATSAPNEMSMAALLAPNGQGGISMSLKGTYYGSEDDLRSLLTSAFSNLPLKFTISSKAMGWLDGLVAVDGNLSTKQPEKSNTFYAKSVITTKPLSEASVASWINYLFRAGLSTNLTWFSQADLYGGVISLVAADDTAFAHRDAFLVFQFYANTPDKDPPFPSAGLSFVDGMVTALDSEPTGAYPNYIDPRLPADKWPSLYFGQHVARLEKVKTEVDPKNVFNFQQGISPSSTNNSGGPDGAKGSNGDPNSGPNVSSSSLAYPCRNLILIYCISSLLWLLCAVPFT